MATSLNSVYMVALCSCKRRIYRHAQQGRASQDPLFCKFLMYCGQYHPSKLLMRPKDEADKKLAASGKIVKASTSWIQESLVINIKSG